VAIKTKLFVLALVITVFLFGSFVFVNSVMENKRESFIESGMQETENNANELETMLIMGDVYGDKMTCMVFTEKLKTLDKSIWNLGLKIDEYRQAGQDIFENPWYLSQKTLFNQQEVLYLSLLKKSKQKCGFKTPIVLFFYQNSVDCRKCDDQSFILGDIRRKEGNDIAVFSFDVDRNLTTVNLLKDFYGVNQLPCLVIDDKTFCGIQDRSTIIKTVCQNANITDCSEV
jgi:hypothetical protein